MTGSLKRQVLGACLLAAVFVGCSKPKPILPKKPVPPGTILLMFTKKVQGPLELSVDGLRIPVQAVEGKRCKQLTITGLATGKHHVVLLSPLDAFSPDQLDMNLEATQGAFKVLYAQQFNSVLYGKPEPVPAADAIPGVKAILEP
jgi:hypothetical protein